MPARARSRLEVAVSCRAHRRRGLGRGVHEHDAAISGGARPATASASRPSTGPPPPRRAAGTVLEAARRSRPVGPPRGTMSSMEVPCPGSSGADGEAGVGHRLARGRIDWGLPVNPWRTSTRPRAAGGRERFSTHSSKEPSVRACYRRASARFERGRVAAAGAVGPTRGPGASAGRLAAFLTSDEFRGHHTMAYAFLSDEWIEQAHKIRTRPRAHGAKSLSFFYGTLIVAPRCLFSARSAPSLRES